MWCQFDHDRVFFARHHKVLVGIRVFVTILLIDVFEVEVRCQVRHHDLHGPLCESLSKAHSLSAVEWCPSKRMSFSPIGCQVEWIIFVKPLRKKLCRPLPMIGIVVKPIEV